MAATKTETTPTMRAWVYTTPGPLESRLTLQPSFPSPNTPTQQLTKGQLLVRVTAASLNPADHKLPELGLLARAIIKLPKTPGMDFSGRVVRVATEGVDDIRPGDAVMGLLSPVAKQGSLAEYVVADVEACVPLKLAADANDTEEKLLAAPGLGVAGLTAYQTIAPNVEKGKGDRVFINGGSGGVGTIGIQIAKALGCQVTVSCSTAKADLCRSLGADEIVDYKTVGVNDALRKLGPVFKLVVDNVGNNPPDLYRASNAFIKPGGKFVSVGGNVSFASVMSQSTALILPGFLGGGKAKFQMYLTKHERKDMLVLADWYSQGKIRVAVDSTFGFGEAVEAFKKLKSGSCAGKVLVRVAEEGAETKVGEGVKSSSG